MFLKSTSISTYSFISPLAFYLIIFTERRRKRERERERGWERCKMTGCKDNNLLICPELRRHFSCHASRPCTRPAWMSEFSWKGTWGFSRRPHQLRLNNVNWVNAKEIPKGYDVRCSRHIQYSFTFPLPTLVRRTGGVKWHLWSPLPLGHAKHRKDCPWGEKFKPWRCVLANQKKRHAKVWQQFKNTHIEDLNFRQHRVP